MRATARTAAARCVPRLLASLPEAVETHAPLQATAACHPSRAQHLFLTLGNQPGLGRSAWEVPVGKLVDQSSLDVMHGIYTGYGDRVDQGRLQPNNPKAKEYLEGFPKLSRFKKCRVERKGSVEL